MAARQGIVKERLTDGASHGAGSRIKAETMPAYAGTIARKQRHSGAVARLLMIPLGAVVAALVFAPMAYMLWPQGGALAPDAPSIPVTVGGTVFNVPPAAVRFKVQRRPGAQARVDLGFVWPSLEPPDDRIKPPTNVPPDVTNRLFATIASADSTLPPLERLKVIYPRYLGGGAVVGADGLSVERFRDGSPYQGEDLIFDPASAERFLLRCTRSVGSTPAMCLHERRIGGADVTLRFPREWLSDWRAVADSLDRLIASFRPLPTPG
jgi:hypothetical protein